MLTIGKVSNQTGLSVKAIRYYESIGLISTPQRAENGYRYYNNTVLAELNFVKGARGAGFSINETKELLELYRDKNRASVEVKTITLEKISDLQQRISAMTNMVDTLQILAQRCHGDQNSQCSILDGLENNQS
ncbi:MAG: Cu(I)-responsive transcriptional regulator [Gammaproteobacteria bacterium]|nr:Cu(I)-responsive transcriptional regulator [Gammaproteobacteria bacterium]